MRVELGAAKKLQPPSESAEMASELNEGHRMAVRGRSGEGGLLPAEGAQASATVPLLLLVPCLLDGGASSH